MDLDIILGILIFFQVLFGLNISMPSFSRNAQSSKITAYNVVRPRSATEKFIVIYFVIRQLLNKHFDFHKDPSHSFSFMVYNPISIALKGTYICT